MPKKASKKDKIIEELREMRRRIGILAEELEDAKESNELVDSLGATYNALLEASVDVRNLLDD